MRLPASRRAFLTFAPLLISGPVPIALFVGCSREQQSPPRSDGILYAPPETITPSPFSPEEYAIYNGAMNTPMRVLRFPAVGYSAEYVLVAAALPIITDGKAQEEAERYQDLIRLLDSAPPRKEWVPRLINDLQDQDAAVRNAAAKALGQIGPSAKEAVPALTATFEDKNQDVHVRVTAADALAQIGPEAKEAVPALTAAFTDKDEDEDVRNSAGEVLRQLGPAAREAVPALSAVLADTGQHKGFRTAAADMLGRIGPEVPSKAISGLTAAITDKGQDVEVRRSAADALRTVAEVIFTTRRTEALPQLKAAHEALSKDSDSLVRRDTAALGRTISYYESLWWVEGRERVAKTVARHPYISVGITAYPLLQLFWLILLWFRPLLLLKVITWLSGSGQKFKIPLFETPIPLKALVLAPFHYHPRLLEAWVQHYLAVARENYTTKGTIKDRRVYVPMPARVGDQMCERLSAAAFQPLFERRRLTVLIAGEGGTGKTSLACQMGAWAMADEPRDRLCKTHRLLPVLLEDNLAPPTDNKDALLEAVHGGLLELIGEKEPIKEELLVQLLRKRRVLVIVDSLSELDETTCRSVRPAQADFPVAALVVTSRLDERLGGASKTTVRTVRLKSDRLSTFMHHYLEQLGKRELFTDAEYFKACGRLTDIVGDREITVLIAKMYAELLVTTKEAVAGALASGDEPPRNLPDLMLKYVNSLNKQVKADRQDIDKVSRAAKRVAWECLNQTFRPHSVKRADVVQALHSETDAERLLKYLGERLQLIQFAGPVAGLVRFTLDPLAEYLAALYLVEECSKNENCWKEFFERAQKQPGAPKTIKDFLLAVRDCCVHMGNESGAPEWVKDEVGRFAGLDPAVVEAAHLKERINHLPI